MSIVTRTNKGKKLTIQEMDGNFTYLDNNINNEISQRTSLDLSLSTSISSEILQRTSSDISLSTSISNISNNTSSSEIVDTVEDGFFVTDINGNIIFKATPDGIDGISLSSGLTCTLSTTSKWHGKKVAFLGDSITQFAIHVNKYITLTSCVGLNYGVGGTRISSSDINDTTSFVSRYSSMSDADLVIVFGGTNDYGQNSGVFGIFTDRVTTTFYGAMHLLCQGLLTKYPKKPIVFMTPIHRSSEINDSYDIVLNTSTSKSLNDYCNVIKEVCGFYSIPVLDSYSESGIDAVINVNNYFSDGLHPNTIGGYKLASYMYEKLEKIYDEYYINNK